MIFYFSDCEAGSPLPAYSDLARAAKVVSFWGDKKFASLHEVELRRRGRYVRSGKEQKLPFSDVQKRGRGE